jgi:anti-anti-sigma factor
MSCWPASSFDVVVERDRTRSTVRPTGELDLASASDLEAILDCECSVAQDCELDLSGITFMDCAGLRVLCDAHATAQRTGCCLRLLNASEPVLRLARLTGAERWLPFADLPRARRFARSSRAVAVQPRLVS